MDIQRACDLLCITPPFSLHELKKKYYKAALRWHPDKNNNSEDSKKRFQEIQEAYEILTKHLDIDFIPEKLVDYKSIFNYFFKNFSDFNPNIIEILKTGCEDTILKLLAEVDQTVLSHLYAYLNSNSTFLHIEPGLLSKLEALLREKTHNYMILHPTLDNLFNDDIYPINYKDDVYYVPLWHDVLTYPIADSKEELTIKCAPYLPEHVSIDNRNNLHVNLTARITDILEKQKLTFLLGKKVFELQVSELNIKKNQIVTLNSRGISKIDQKTIFNIDNKSNIVIYLELI